jgi:hypothetical protein
MMKKLLAMLMAMMMILSLTAAGAETASDKQYVLDKGTLVVGITDFAPMDYRDENGDWIGFDADVARAFAADCADGKCRPEELTEDAFGNYLFSAGIPDPELIIRPSGEVRLSNFLLWQCAYSEFYFCDTLWPDFNEKTLDAAIIDYQKRDRRFGGVKK